MKRRQPVPAPRQHRIVTTAENWPDRVIRHWCLDCQATHMTTPPPPPCPGEAA